MPRNSKLKRISKQAPEITFDLDIDFIPRENPKPIFHAEGFQFTVINPIWIEPIRTARTRSAVPPAENKRCILHMLRSKQLNVDNGNSECIHGPRIRNCRSRCSLLGLICCCWAGILKLGYRL